MGTREGSELCQRELGKDTDVNELGRNHVNELGESVGVVSHSLPELGESAPTGFVSVRTFVIPR